MTQPTPLDPNSVLAAAEAAGIKLTSPDRVVYPGQGVTKADLVAYYAAVAERMLPYIENRPLSLLRCPQGRSKFCFSRSTIPAVFPMPWPRPPSPRRPDPWKYYASTTQSITKAMWSAVASPAS